MRYDQQRNADWGHSGRRRRLPALPGDTGRRWGLTESGAEGKATERGRDEVKWRTARLAGAPGQALGPAAVSGWPS